MVHPSPQRRVLIAVQPRLLGDALGVVLGREEGVAASVTARFSEDDVADVAIVTEDVRPTRTVPVVVRLPETSSGVGRARVETATSLHEASVRDLDDVRRIVIGDIALECVAG